MFEKEAEEIVKRNVCGDCNKCQSYGYIGCDIYRYSKDSCLYGLRTGYNKAIVEIKDAYEGNGNFSAWFENYLEDKNV